MEKCFIKYLLILLFVQLTSACSIDMIAGTEEENQSELRFHDSERGLTIVPAFRTHLNANEDPRLSEQFASRNQSALRQLDSDIRQINRLNPLIRHTLVTENNDTNFRYTDYIRNWKISIELYVNSQYPKNFNYQAPNGNALVDVAITKSGKLYSYSIILSSGSPSLTISIKDILHNMILFAPLDADIQKDTDILHITQMWQFRD